MNCSDHSAKGNDIHRLLLSRSVHIGPFLIAQPEQITRVNTSPHTTSGLFEHERRNSGKTSGQSHKLDLKVTPISAFDIPVSIIPSLAFKQSGR
tara:strand:+ start:375 stop:656 length:282 start_codon:yes stop_codon:yes gene_type:complete